MTANEMADMLEEKLDRADSFGSPGYEDFDLTSVLTEAQELYVKKFFDEMNNRKQKGFEETEIRNQGLSALVKDGDNLTASADQTGISVNNNVTGKFYDLARCESMKLSTGNVSGRQTKRRDVKGRRAPGA